MKSRYSYIVIIFCLLIHVGKLSPLWGNDFINRGSSNFELLTVDNGLSSNMTRDIVQDKEGFIWFATAKGLNRFDGKNIKEFIHDPKDETSISGNYISSLYIDSKGTLWVGTMEAGLCRYNEDDTFERFIRDKKNPLSINDNQVRCVYEDSNQNFWIGTQKGLNLLDREKGAFIAFEHDKKVMSTLPGHAVLSMVEDQQGRLYVGTWGGGLALVSLNDDKSLSVIRLNIQKDKTVGLKNIWSLESDRQGNIWIGSHGGGLALLPPPLCDDLANCTPEDFPIHLLSPNQIFNNANILDITLDRKNRLWIGGNKGVGLLDLEKIKDKPVTDIWSTINFEEKLLVGSNTRSSIEPSIYKIFEDEEGLIWLSSKKGVYKYLRDYYTFSLYLNQENKEWPRDVQCFVEDRNNNNLLWIGTSEKGLIAYDKIKHTAKYIQDDKTESAFKAISSLYQDKKGNIWAGTYLGDLYEISFDNAGNPTLEHFIFDELKKGNETPIWKIEEDTDGKLLIATHHGLYTYQMDTKEFGVYTSTSFGHPLYLQGKSYFDLVNDGKGSLWIATAGDGLNRLKRFGNQESFLKYLPNPDDENSINSNIIFHLEMVDSSLWIVSQSGIQEYNITQDSFYTDEYLNKEINSQVLAFSSNNKDRIWISTEDALFTYNLRNKILSKYNKQDGLLSEFKFKSSYVGTDGQLYFGGSNGFHAFKGDEIADRFNKKILFTDLKLFNKSVEPNVKNAITNTPVLTKSITKTEHISLHHKHDLITFEFAVLDYVESNRYQYTYQLEGFDKEWTTTGYDTNASYTNLAPGTYKFKVKAKNSKGIWSHPKILEVTITAPFWQKGPFYFLLFMLTGASLYLLQRRREARINKYNNTLEEQVRERTSALKETIQQLKDKEQSLSENNIELEKYVESNNQLENFAYIASHDLQAPLRTINSFTKLLEKSLKNKLNEREEEFLAFITSSTQNMQEMINALLTFSRVNSQKREIQLCSPLNLVKTIQAELGTTLAEENATIEIIDFPESIHADRIKLKQLFQNLITNGIKFSRKEIDPVVQIKCKEENEHWQFQVKDNGIGISKENNEKIFQLFSRLHSNAEFKGTGIGLALCKKLVEQHNGEIWVNSKKGEGSNFYFTISKALN